MAKDILVPPRRDGADESIAEFFTRRLGAEAYERVVEPLLAGIHAGDATRLSLAATFPRFVDMERTHGGLVRGRAWPPGAPPPPDRPPPATPPSSACGAGWAKLTRALEARLDSAGAKVVTGCRVTGLRPSQGTGDDPGGGMSRSPRAAALPSGPTPSSWPPPPWSPPLCSAPSCPRPPPCSTRSRMRGRPRSPWPTGRSTWGGARPGSGSSSPGPRAGRSSPPPGVRGSGRAGPPRGTVLVRGYVGGIGREDVLDLSDGAIIRLVEGELAALAGITGVPRSVEVHRYPAGMPQYTVGHLDRVARVREQVAVCPAWP